MAADRWDYQVIISLYDQDNGVVCDFFSLKNAKDTPCTWPSGLTPLNKWDQYAGDEWHLPVAPGDDPCAPCPEGMGCDGVVMAMLETTTTPGRDR